MVRDFTNDAVCCCACVPENTNWPQNEHGKKANKTGGAYPPDTTPGLSNLPVQKKGTFPVMPPLPVKSRYAPDGSDEWDGQLERVDNDPDGYYTGMCGWAMGVTVGCCQFQ